MRAVYDDIMKTRGTDWINNFWKALANDPRELRRVSHTAAALPCWGCIPAKLEARGV